MIEHVTGFRDESQADSFDKVLGTILKHVDANTTLIVFSDHGIKPLRESAFAAGVVGRARQKSPNSEVGA